jgi:RNA polymerase sigma-70 factor (ECF subfamily)
MVGNREDAMDLTQEAFLRVHRNWARRNPEGPLTPWFYRILRNVAIDHLRKRASRKEYALDNMIETETNDLTSLEEQTELRRVLWQAIGKLPEAQREVVVLRDVHGRSYAEIGSAVGIPSTTVATRLHHAREKLRHKLERYL